MLYLFQFHAECDMGEELIKDTGLCCSIMLQLLCNVSAPT